MGCRIATLCTGISCISPLTKRGASHVPKTAFSLYVLMKRAWEDALMEAITRDGRIFFDDSQIANPGELPLRIQKRIGPGAPPTVYIQADIRAHYRHVVRVIDCLHDAGMQKIGLLTEPRPRTEEGLLH